MFSPQSFVKAAACDALSPGAPMPRLISTGAAAALIGLLTLGACGPKAAAGARSECARRGRRRRRPRRAGQPDRGTQRPHLGLPGVRSPAAGQRHHPGAAVPGRLGRPGGPGALPDRSGHLSRRLRQRQAPAWPRRQAASTTAKLKADRYKELVAINAVSQQDNDDAQAAAQQAAANVAGPARRRRAGADQPRLHPGRSRRSPAASAGRRSPPARWSPPARPTALATIQQLDPIYVDVTQSARRPAGAAARHGGRRPSTPPALGPRCS